MLSLVRLATALLPPSHRARFHAEWVGDVTEIEHTEGKRAATVFAASLILAAARMTRTIRSNSLSAYVELSAAALSALIPTAALATWALADGRWPIVGAQAAIGIGIVLVAAGLWASDGRLLDSTGSRLGLVLVLIGSAIGTTAIRYNEFSPLADQRIDVSLANVAVLVGLAMLASANYLGSRRPKVQLASLYVLLPASIVLVCIAVINTTHLAGMARLSVLVYAVPALTLSWACFSIMGQRQVFAASGNHD